ncbi:hypothetical protein HMPREF1550_01870 [Actinomyces sp. oral taxon 877 str. F0543]|nr:hypothetical protein HMPREF1550_01870 [Actinomyces sp. oral taxon 877 str. F0543]
MVAGPNPGTFRRTAQGYANARRPGCGFAVNPVHNADRAVVDCAGAGQGPRRSEGIPGAPAPDRPPSGGTRTGRAPDADAAHG